jgi:hypothetical protein
MRARLQVAALVVALAIAAAPSSGAASAHPTVERIICGVFGPYCSQALRVAWCESRLRTTAANGQYLGVFQMGDYARAKYGHGSDAWTQAQAAFRYFADSGFGWGPWTCKP